MFAGRGQDDHHGDMDEVARMLRRGMEWGFLVGSGRGGHVRVEGRRRQEPLGDAYPGGDVTT